MSQCSYLEGENVAPRTAAEARKLIGKRVEYLLTRDIDRSGRGYVSPSTKGTVTDVSGRNIEISDQDWLTFTRIVEMRLLP